MVRAVIFDFDGLLFDTEPVWDKTHFKFLKLHNFLDIEVGDTTGIGLRDFIEILQSKGLSGETDDLLAEYRKIFYEMLKDQKDILMPGALKILQKASQKGLTIALNSGGHTERKLKKMLKEQGILDYFSVITSSDDVKRGKPAPDVYFESARKVDQAPTNCLALEDSVNGVLAAKTAGIRVYGVNPDQKMRDALETAKADKVFKNLADIKL